MHADIHSTNTSITSDGFAVSHNLENMTSNTNTRAESWARLPLEHGHCTIYSCCLSLTCCVTGTFFKTHKRLRRKAFISYFLSDMMKLCSYFQQNLPLLWLPSAVLHENSAKSGTTWMHAYMSVLLSVVLCTFMHCVDVTKIVSVCDMHSVLLSDKSTTNFYVLCRSDKDGQCVWHACEETWT